MTKPPAPKAFDFHRPDRRVIFGAGAPAAVLEVIDSGYVLLTTQRALAAFPLAGENAGKTIFVPSGRVDELAAEVLRECDDPALTLLALGGGRVVDVAKAVVSAGGGSRVAAIPTTLSAAEMTGFHRMAQGAPQGSKQTLPQLVGNDPALSASQPDDKLAASSANSLAHALAAATVGRSNHVPAGIARSAVGYIDAGWEAGGSADREWVALGALLGGWAVAVTGLMLHHAMAQTLVRSSGAAHAAVNVALLPATIERLELTQPTEMAWLSDGLVRSLPALAVQLRANAAITGLDDLGISHDHLTAAAATVVERSDFAYLAPDTTRAQLEQLYERAF